MTRESSRSSLRWYLMTSSSKARLSPRCARSTSCWSISLSLIRPWYWFLVAGAMPARPLGGRLATKGLLASCGIINVKLFIPLARISWNIVDQTRGQANSSSKS